MAEKFRIVDLIGSGGMGSVYLATNVTLLESVAIKIIHAHLSGIPEFRRRFEQEARSLAALKQDNLVKLYTFGQLDSGSVFMVLEFVEGRNLNELIVEDGPLEPPAAVGYALQICRAMHSVHECGIVHRDLKSSNLRVSSSGIVKLFDFGISSSLLEPQLDLTKTGALIGSPGYMSPEQCRGESLDHRSDIYSLGCIMYEMLCGKLPFEGESAFEVMNDHLHKCIERVPCQKPIPAKLESIILRCLRKEPADRCPI